MDELQPGQLLFHIFAWPVKKINKKTSVAQRCGGNLCCGRVVCQTRKRAEIKQKQSTVHVDLLEQQTGRGWTSDTRGGNTRGRLQQVHGRVVIFMPYVYSKSCTGATEGQTCLGQFLPVHRVSVDSNRQLAAAENVHVSLIIIERAHVDLWPLSHNNLLPQYNYITDLPY